MISAPKTRSTKRSDPFLVWISLIMLFGLAFPSCWAIDCYVCKSEENSGCTSTKPSGDPLPAVNCTNPNRLFHDWMTSHDFMKFGIGDFNLEKAFNSATEETEKGSGVQNVTACAYMFASTENKVTAEVDRSISKVRGFFGDENADDAITIQKWVMRDCVTLPLKEGAKNDTNRCVPVSGLKDIAKVQFCTCTSDKCNFPNSDVKAFIKEAETSGVDGPSKGLDVLLLGSFLALGIWINLLVKLF